MVALDIDFEVYKALTNRRATEDVSYNEVLRELLGLKASAAQSPTPPSGWTCKGVTLPDGTELRAEFKGKLYTAKIVDRAWVQEGFKERVFGSPSAAAFAITDTAYNGWGFWQVKRPSDPAWMPLSKLRKP
jgi:hypothetical protein